MEIDFNVDASTEFATRWFCFLLSVLVIQRKRVLKCVNGWLTEEFRYAIFDPMKSISSKERAAI